MNKSDDYYEAMVYLERKAEMAHRIYLPILLAIGGPLNIFALFLLIGQFRRLKLNRRSITDSHSSTALLLLKLNINVSDLLVMFVYVPGQFGWALSIQWRAGDLACKLFKFLAVLAFQSSSFAIMCLATERALTIRKGIQAAWRKSPVKWMIGASWLVAILLSTPQLFVWTVYQPFLNHSNSSSADFVQCTTIFNIERYQTGMENPVAVVFHVGNMIVAFWIPALYLAVAYAYVYVKLYRYGKGEPIKEIQKEAFKRPAQSGEMDSIVAVEPAMAATGADEPQPGKRISQWRMRLRSKRHLFSQTGLIVLAYLVCWLPYFLASIFPAGLKPLSMLLPLNAAINPMLYAFE